VKDDELEIKDKFFTTHLYNEDEVNNQFKSHFFYKLYFLKGKPLIENRKELTSMMLDLVKLGYLNGNDIDGYYLSDMGTITVMLSRVDGLDYLNGNNIEGYHTTDTETLALPNESTEMLTPINETKEIPKIETVYFNNSNNNNTNHKEILSCLIQQVDDMDVYLWKMNNRILKLTAEYKDARKIFESLVELRDMIENQLEEGNNYDENK
jgi:hypothetical protein